MRVDILTIFPELFDSFLRTSLVGRAREQGLLKVQASDLRAFATDRHRTVDDQPYGGGGGMVMTAPPWISAVRTLDPDHGALRVLLSPQGQRLDDQRVQRLATKKHIVLLCGRYEGLDERVLDLVVDLELSIGDYVLSGGEVAAMVVVETISRQIPGVVGRADSVENDSFRTGVLDHPQYTRPLHVEGLPVPRVLRSGDHEKIRDWRERGALEATRKKRPDLLPRNEA